MQINNQSRLKIGLINLAPNEDSPPMNLAYLAAALKKSGFKQVKIIDHTFVKKNLASEIKGLDCVGISAMSKYYHQAIQTAREIKRSFNVPIIIGGSHITTVPDSLSSEFSLGVIGEAEQTIVRLGELLLKEGAFTADALREIPGLVFWDKGQVFKTSIAQLISNLDDIPIPDYSLLDRNYFKDRWIIWNQKMGRSMKIITSRGCPFDCIFCASKQIWKIVRLHSAERIFREVKQLHENWGIDHIYIDDDLFIIDKERVRQFAQLVRQEGLIGKVSFFCSVRSNLLDEATCSLLKELGVKVLNFGFESGSNRLLQYLKGGSISVESHKQAITLCNKYGLKVWGSLMLGSPTETLEEMGKTVDFIDYAIKNGCQRLGLFVATALPGTEFFEIAKKRGKAADDMDWSLVDYANCRQPLLLDDAIDRKYFQKIFNQVKAKTDRLLLKDSGYRTIIFRFRKALNLLIREPQRAVSLLKNILRSNAHTQ